MLHAGSRFRFSALRSSPPTFCASPDRNSGPAISQTAGRDRAYAAAARPDPSRLEEKSGKEYQHPDAQHAPILGPIVLACGTIFMSNFSTSAITFCTCWIMLYVGRVKTKELVKLLVLIAGVMILAVSVMYIFNIGRSHTWSTDWHRHTRQPDRADRNAK